MDIQELTLAQASAAVKKKELSPVDLVQACLSRIDAVNSKTNAYISVYADEALKVAKASEALMMAGHDMGVLHGVPISLKDNISLKGKRTTAGSKVLSDWHPQEDASVSQRLRGAGAIFIGKCNLHEFAWGGTSNNPHYGSVRNPWNTDTFPAGSSGGSGVAVAARTCYGSIGTDTGGSVRLPSSVNGIVGIRPTYGRVSNHGIIPLAWSMDTAGPMTRTVEDCAMMFNVMAGHDHNDPASALQPVVDYTRDLNMDLKGVRIGVVPGYSFKHLQPAVERSMREAVKTLESLGAVIIEVPIANIEGNMSAVLTVESVEPSTYHQKWLREQPDNYGEDVRTLLEAGELLMATHYVQAQRYRAMLRDEFLEAFKRVDVFLWPTLPFTATKVGATTVVIENGQEEDMLSAIMQFTGVPSLTGLPALNVPCGFDDAGLPVGMQLVGRPFDEATLFRIGSQFERQTEFYKKAPNL